MKTTLTALKGEFADLIVKQFGDTGMKKKFLLVDVASFPVCGGTRITGPGFKKI